MKCFPEKRYSPALQCKPLTSSSETVDQLAEMREDGDETLPGFTRHRLRSIIDITITGFVDKVGVSQEVFFMLADAFKNELLRADDDEL